MPHVRPPPLDPPLPNYRILALIVAFDSSIRVRIIKLQLPLGIRFFSLRPEVGRRADLLQAYGVDSP